MILLKPVSTRQTKAGHLQRIEKVWLRAGIRMEKKIPRNHLVEEFSILHGRNCSKMGYSRSERANWDSRVVNT
jgi:hypothetical protein